MLLASPEQVRAARMQKDLAYFVQEMWPVLEPGVEILWNWHMDLICKYLEKVTHNEIRHLIICVPPGTAKSLLVSVMMPAWEWLSKPYESTIFASNDEGLAERDSIKCRQIVGSVEYQEVLQLLYEANCIPGVWGMHPQVDRKDHFATTEGGFRQALTVDKPITGKRAAKAIIDDPTDAGDVTRFSMDIVRARLDSVYTWYTKSLSTRLKDVSTGHFVIIMQRLHELDLVGRLQHNPNYTVLCLPMEYDPEIAHPEDPRRLPGELLFPARFPRWWVDEQKGEEGLGRVQAAAQFGQRPIPTEGGAYRQEFFKQRYPWKNEIPRDEFVAVLLSGDIANKKKAKNDSTCFKLLGLRNNGHVYVLRSYTGKHEYAAMVTLFYGLLLDWNPGIVVIEEAANGTALLSALEHLLDPDVSLDILSPKEREVAAVFRGRLVVNKEKATEGKEVRARAQTTWYTPQCRVWLPTDDCPWVGQHIDQHLRFGSSASDDEVDTMSQGLKHLAQFSPPKVSGSYGISASPPPTIPGESRLEKKAVEVRENGMRHVSRFMLPTQAHTNRGW